VSDGIGELDVPAFGVYDVETHVVLAADSVRLVARELDAMFAGVRQDTERRGLLGAFRRAGAAGDRIAGLWLQAGGLAPLTLVRTADDPRPRRWQDPDGAVPYGVEEVRFAAGDGSTLAGTLTLPQGDGAVPAVVLISGSGPHDRDGAMAGHRPFLVLGDHLARHGIAVLRFDERGVGQSSGDFHRATTHDFAADVQAALGVLAAHPRIDSSRLGLVGHSEGGMIAPMVANRSADVAFLVLLAAPGLPLADVSIQQSEAILRAERRPADEIEASVRAARRLMRLVTEVSDEAHIAVEARTILHESLLPLQLPAALHERQLAIGVARFTSPWMQHAARLDPGAELQRVARVPVLALNGDLDSQVLAGPNLQAIRAALATAGNPDVTLRELPGLNHLFQTAFTGAPSEYGLLAETFAPAALELISGWILHVLSHRR
jgi:uncharacterized protein